ncbi:MAG: GDP-mannose 4,6-dehydratase [Candidatus Taylorbacteria bacterium RIFCSPLOWO2_12_FULL_43_20]|uniref:GDP-mannose 4,6-dehydratase n=1 Tax=Candidatus Taylorbacteria bacterium RIFCSPLOWO2_12_FULL_43_20 TaxID=1802332 RepID=A0A1G2P0L0_9BACT|nr:MAG: GDP-mannose 4,6-dehydratase [Candidatus Taylorbacteria bacterium RIFCSPHIGHO2_01_FULL_43_120]OHA22399.1 MAG: GDP-mannose 4,6-dehydratase [Candidatus Taylorbacteria bacterium RIFCSPHIGHO2_02_FULL_43_55]OHA28338.1 MAG: GDP-mannose 4,6-dehydratase [Candidatus Taylorbacteria bacterium RIFCSPHIGHO2_12_FULL_42_34]OHA30612.1 MAG: GDP-mannose 4,6-dehydratase [Candidatus Taylorbacteria bacterium RIFCSPLOWO2_01_FULL_43_83]OHA38509.1 MAG: GDP-mannose 4,6-dehydratase [Candidatus Taylorbacteria bact
MKLKRKSALITGITGQDGSYLAEFLVAKGYKVYGLVRRTSTDPLARLESLYFSHKVTFINGNMRDSAALQRAVEIAKPDEIYNLAAQSDVGISFTCPEETMEVNYHGLGRLLYEAMKVNPKVRIYQASTSEMFGRSKPPQSEKTDFHPVSPYGEAKLRAHLDYVVGYREKHGLYICSGILFNHESPRRGKHFVTRKITHSLAKIKLGLQDKFELGNLEAKRDWGFAGDYIEAMWMMLQKPMPEDFVVATGESHTVRDFVEEAAGALNIKISWHGKGLRELAKDEGGKVILSINKSFFRPEEVVYLLGNSSKARKVLGWKPKVKFKELVKLMIEHDLKNLAH